MTATPARDGARVAVVTLAHGRHDHLRGQLGGLAGGDLVPDLYVVAAMDDPAVAGVVAGAETDLGGVAGRTLVLEVRSDGTHLPLARARNAAAEAAGRAGADVLVFLDVDCIPAPDLVRTYRDACLARARATPATPEVVSGPVHYLAPRGDDGPYGEDDLARSVPHAARPVVRDGEMREADDLLLFWSLSFALTRDSWQTVGGFDEGYVGYGGEDTDWAMRLRRAGGRLWWLRGATAFHQHHPVDDPPVGHLADIVDNSNRFHERWGFFPMRGWLDAFARRGLVTLGGTPPRWRLSGDDGRSARTP